MFQRISHEQWVHIVPVISFVITFTVFAVATICALRISRNDRKRLAALPLNLPEETSP